MVCRAADVSPASGGSLDLGTLQDLRQVLQVLEYFHWSVEQIDEQAGWLREFLEQAPLPLPASQFLLQEAVRTRLTQELSSARSLALLTPFSARQLWRTLQLLRLDDLLEVARRGPSPFDPLNRLGRLLEAEAVDISLALFLAENFRQDLNRLLPPESVEVLDLVLQEVQEAWSEGWEAEGCEALLAAIEITQTCSSIAEDYYLELLAGCGPFQALSLNRLHAALCSQDPRRARLRLSELEQELLAIEEQLQHPELLDMARQNLRIYQGLRQNLQLAWAEQRLPLLDLNLLLLGEYLS